MKIFITLNLLVSQVMAGHGRRSGLEVAMCRAHCLALFTESQDCWAACDSPCEKVEELGEEARAGCEWHSNTNRVDHLQSRRSEVWQLSQPLTVSNCEVRWGEVEVSRNSFRSSKGRQESSTSTVTILLGLDQSGQWREISQSQARGVRLQPGLAAHLVALRLVVVGEEGVRLTQDWQLDREQCDYSEALSPVVTGSHSEGELLVRLSLSLGEAREEQEYLVRYQELPLSSSALGSLVVNTPRFSLTLVRDSKYLVQVENINSGEISPPLIITTTIPETLTATIILITVLVTSFILIAALSVMLWRRYRSQPGERKEELNNNKSCNIILDPTLVEPLKLDYNNIC